MKLSKSNSGIKRIQCKSALNRLRGKLPYKWDLNIYRGCGHACKYCYAIYSHKYIGENDFSKILAKTNIVEKLDKELSRPSWKKEVVNIGGVTDSYQKAEAELKIMPEVLKTLIRHKTPAIISTKSDLILRDYDLIDELSKITYVNIASTITTMDEEVRQKIEPNAATSAHRFKMLKEFRKTNASVGLHTMPIIPFVTDDNANIEQLCSEANNVGVHYLLPGILYLRGDTRKVFFGFIKQTYPEKYHDLKELYKKGGADKLYKNNLYSKIVRPLMKKYGLSMDYMKVMGEKMPGQAKQLTLF